MTGTTLISIVFATIAVVLLIFGYLHEDKVIAFEDRMIYAIARMWKRHMRRRRIRQRAKQKANLRVISSNRRVQKCGRTA